MNYSLGRCSFDAPPHRWMAWGTLAVSCIHGAVYVMQWTLAWTEGAGSYREVAWKLTDRNVTGLLALAAALAIGATSFAWVRAHHYRVRPMACQLGLNAKLKGGKEGSLREAPECAPFECISGLRFS